MLPELQQPNIVGNFLSAYGTAQAQQQAQQDRQRTMQRQDVADQRQGQQFDMQMDLGKLEMAQKQTAAMNEILSTVDPANPASLDMAKQRFLQTFGGDPQAVAGITMADIPRIKMQTGQTAAELDLQYKRAQIAATNRSNRGDGGGGGIANTAAQREQLALRYGIDPRTPAGQKFILEGKLPDDPSGKPMNDEQAKALGFAKRIGDANAALEDPMYSKALLSLGNNAAASVPFVGNSMVSNDYQMADQAVRDFINAQLRRESGAVISEQEFDNARRQYIPVYGDKPQVLERKRVARQRALENLYVSAGPRGYQTAQEVAPPPAPPPAAVGGNVPPLPPGFVVTR